MAPSTTTVKALPNVKHLHADLNDEMDEYAPVRLAFVALLILIGILIYFMVKSCWRRRSRSRVSAYERLNNDNMWNAALLSDVN